MSGLSEFQYFYSENRGEKNFIHVKIFTSSVIKLSGGTYDPSVKRIHILILKKTVPKLCD